MHPQNWNWKIFSLWIAVVIELVMILGLVSGKSSSTVGPYNQVCHQEMYYDNGGYDSTFYWPCSNVIP